MENRDINAPPRRYIRSQLRERRITSIQQQQIGAELGKRRRHHSSQAAAGTGN
jgi:hypothetical protein